MLEDEMKNVRCNYCRNEFKEDEILFDDDYEECCPHCNKTGYLMDLELFQCQCCGKFITDDKGITTLNGYWVCDDDSCRTLDSESQAIEKEIKYSTEV